MELVFKTSDEPPYKPGKNFSVVVTCLDVTASMKAWEILELLEQKLKGEAGRILHLWWNSEVLNHTEPTAVYIKRPNDSVMVREHVAIYPIRDGG